jgi:hypothetical protein
MENPTHLGTKSVLIGMTWKESMKSAGRRFQIEGPDIVRMAPTCFPLGTVSQDYG